MIKLNCLMLDNFKIVQLLSFCFVLVIYNGFYMILITKQFVQIVNILGYIKKKR